MVKPSSELRVQALADLDQVVHAPARLMVLTYLYVVESIDYVFLMRLTGLTWGNLATHLGKLEEASYIKISRQFKGKKPHSTVRLTRRGRLAFTEYKARMLEALNDLPG